MRYKYFVTFFQGKTEEDKKFGQTVLEVVRPITDVEQVQQIEKYLQLKLGVRVAVIAFSLLQEVAGNVNRVS